MFAQQILRLVSTHSHPKVAAADKYGAAALSLVSTHSHPKVAATVFLNCAPRGTCFNTQPPEGGCVKSITSRIK